MTTHPMLLAKSAQYRQEELRSLGGHRTRGQAPSRSPRVWRRFHLRFVLPMTLHPRPTASRQTLTPAGPPRPS
jgi:hypothetical protein